MRPKSSSPSWVFTRPQTRLSLTTSATRVVSSTCSGVNGSRNGSDLGLEPSRRNSSGSIWLADGGFWPVASDEVEVCGAAAAGPAAAEAERFSGAAAVPLSPVFAEVADCAASPADGLAGALGFFAAARLRGAGEVCARTAQGRSRHTAASAEMRRMRSLSTRTEAAQVTWRGGRVKESNRQLSSRTSADKLSAPRSRAMHVRDERRLRPAARRGAGRGRGARRREAGRHRRAGGGRQRGHAGDRAHRRHVALARPAQDRGEIGPRRQAGARGATRLPAALPRGARRAPRHLGHAPQHRRQHAGPGERGHAVRDQGDGGAGEAEPPPRDRHQRPGAVRRHQHREPPTRPHHRDRPARRRALQRPGRHPAAHARLHRLRAHRGDRFGQAPRTGGPVTLRHFLESGSNWALAGILVGIPLYDWLKGVKVYEAFVEGAKEGFQVAVRIIPYLVAILATVGAFRAAGAMDALARILAPVTSRLGLPPEVLPMAIVRPLSGGGALGVLGSIFSTPGLGPDSYAGRLVFILKASTETTFYVLSVYCGSVGIVRYRHALAAGLLADGAGLVASILIARLVWG